MQRIMSAYSFGKPVWVFEKRDVPVEEVPLYVSAGWRVLSTSGNGRYITVEIGGKGTVVYEDPEARGDGE